MCRWAAYLGPETYLEDIISSPCHSLVAQSHDAHEAKTRTNGDGFGVAWYGNRDEPFQLPSLRFRSLELHA